jgi:excisionase family DNA binding protein
MDNKQIADKLIESIRSIIEVEEKPLTFEEAKAFLQVSSSTLYKLTHRKQIRYLKPGGGKLWFAKKDLVNWMSRNIVESQDKIDEKAVNYLINK